LRFRGSKVQRLKRQKNKEVQCSKVQGSEVEKIKTLKTVLRFRGSKVKT
jgi:hypothetical protein